MHTALEEYQPRQFYSGIIASKYFLFIQKKHQHHNVEYTTNLYRISSKKQLYYVYFLITFLILAILLYWNLYRNILKNCNTRYLNQKVYQFKTFTIMKISLIMVLVERAETCSCKYRIVNKLPNWKLRQTTF
jgi:hypothetical protein